MLICVIAPMVLGFLLGVSSVAIIKFPVAFIVVACVVSMTVVSIQYMLNQSSPTSAVLVRRETVGTGQER